MMRHRGRQPPGGEPAPAAGRLAGKPRAAVLAALLLGPWACHGPGAPPNVLLVTMDTTRRDHCSVYGYERETTQGREEGTRQLFDLEADPGERTNLRDAQAETAAALAARLEAWRQAHAGSPPGPPSHPLTDDERARLRALGYVH